jgi:hypothetical protein
MMQFVPERKDDNPEKHERCVVAASLVANCRERASYEDGR